MKDFDSTFQVIGHRTRREILSFLNRKEMPVTSSEILARFSVSWPTLCLHLKKLEEAGVVVKQSQGREVYYSLKKQRLVGIIKTWIQSFED